MLTLFNSHFSLSFSTSPPKTLVLFESSIRKFSLTVMVPVKEILVPGGIDKLLRNERNKHCSCFLNLSKTCNFCSIYGFVFKCRHSWTLVDFSGNKSFGRFKKSFLSVGIGKFWLVFAIILFLSSLLHIISSQVLNFWVHRFFQCVVHKGRKKSLIVTIQINSLSW